METDDIIKFWQFPKKTIINRRLSKNKILPYIKNPKDKQFLIDSVHSVYMLANFKTENTNIPVYKSEKELYQEIWFYYIKPKKEGLSEKIYRLLSSLIPYPIVVLIDEPKNFIVYAGRFETMSTSYLKLMNVYPSPVYKNEEIESVLKKLALSELPHQNFKILYDSLRDEIVTRLAKIQHDNSIEKMTTETKDQVDRLVKRSEELRRKIKMEKQLNRRIEMQMRLRQVIKEMKILIEK